jgi:diadenosine tetraphosphate (Ap4A) HIT family hydrolase
MSEILEGSPFGPVDPERILFEEPDGLAFYDRYPVSQGHTLIVPKRIVPSLFDLDEREQAALWALAGQVRRRLNDLFHPDGFNIGVNDGDAAGQTVPHAHIHVIPRYRNDVPDPRGGIRRVIPGRAAWWKPADPA